MDQMMLDLFPKDEKIRFQTEPKTSFVRRPRIGGTPAECELLVFNAGRARLMDDLIAALYDLYKNDIYSLKRCCAALWCDELDLRRVFKEIDKRVDEMNASGEMKFLKKRVAEVFGEKDPI